MGSLARVSTLPAWFMGGCTGLTTVTFPPCLVEFGEGAFHDCTSLTDIDMGSLLGVTKLPKGMMSGCLGLRSVRLPPNVEELGENAFA